MTLKEDNENINKCAKESEFLEKIINEQHSPLVKTHIGYDHTQCDVKNQYNVVQGRYESSHTYPRSRSIHRHKG